MHEYAIFEMKFQIIRGRDTRNKEILSRNVKYKEKTCRYFQYQFENFTNLEKVCIHVDGNIEIGNNISTNIFGF